MVFLTSKRIRYLGMIIGVSCILLGLVLLSFPHTDWRIEHVGTYPSFLLLPLTGIITIFFTRVRDVASIINNAEKAGYEASEEEKRLEEESMQEVHALYLLVPLAYTVASLLLIYFVVEPSGIFATELVYGLYLVFTWGVPILLINLIAIPYSNYRRYAKLRAFWHKSVEGARLQRRMRELGVGKPGDLRILNEDELKKKRED